MTHFTRNTDHIALTGVETPQQQNPLYLALQQLGGFWSHTAEIPGWGFYAMPIYLKDR